MVTNASSAGWLLRISQPFLRDSTFVIGALVPPTPVIEWGTRVWRPSLIHRWELRHPNHIKSFVESLRSGPRQSTPAAPKPKAPKVKFVPVIAS